jgi:hypothetical protein
VIAICSNGHENPEGLKFCGECGVAIAALPANCPNGHENAHGRKFCGECGAALLTPPPPQALRPPIVELPASPRSAVVDRDQLGELTKIGQGGQGVVYRAPKVKTTFAASMVYKEYKTQVLAGIDFIALAAMPALVEDTLSYQQAERLISIAAWPCAVVEAGGTPSGFVMPVIPEGFFTELTTVKGISSTAAEFAHLLNHPTVLDARGITIDDTQRYGLLREAASALAFLHKHGVCVGDISPKNLLYCVTPDVGVYFIDCDAMRINGVSVLPQVQTPGWEVPSGEELATIYSDTYKLGLLALRLLVGDHDTTNPADLPSTTPGLLRQIITDTLTNPPHQRPLPEAWNYVLGHTIEETRHRKLTATSEPAPIGAAAAPPSIPVVRFRPTIGSSTSPSATPSPKAATRKATVPTRTEADFWIDAGIDPIRIVLGAQTLFTLRCFVDHHAYFLGRRRTIRTFTTRHALIDHLAAAGDHDLVDLITFPAVIRAAAAREIALPISPENTYALNGMENAVEEDVDEIDAPRLELAAELALDVADYTGDVTMVELCRPEGTVYELVSAMMEGAERRVAENLRIAAAPDWRILTKRMMTHLRADTR